MKRSNTVFIILAFMAGLLGGMLADYVAPVFAEGQGAGVVVHVPDTGITAKKRVVEAHEFRLMDRVSGRLLARLAVDEAGNPALVMFGGRDKKNVSVELSSAGLQVFDQVKDN